MNNGWISIHRKIKDSPIYKDSQAVHLWLHLILSANHKDNKLLIGNQTINIPRGSLLTGRKSLSKATGIHESKIQRLLKVFEKEKQIEQQTFSKFRLISITNYNSYQDNEQQLNSKRTTAEQQLNTNNNVLNNVINNKPLKRLPKRDEDLETFAVLNSLSRPSPGMSYFDYRRKLEIEIRAS